MRFATFPHYMNTITCGQDGSSKPYPDEYAKGRSKARGTGKHPREGAFLVCRGPSLPSSRGNTHSSFRCRANAHRRNAGTGNAETGFVRSTIMNSRIARPSQSPGSRLTRCRLIAWTTNDQDDRIRCHAASLRSGDKASRQSNN